MFKEEEHPRDEIGRFVEKTSDGLGGEHVATEAEQKRLEELGISESNTISLPDERLPRSLSARWANYEFIVDGKKYSIAEGSKLTHKEVFAGKGCKRKIDEIDRLVEVYRVQADEWMKVKAKAILLDEYGNEYKSEIHWYEENGEKYEMKFKKWLE